MPAPDPTFRCPRPPDWRVDWDGLVADHPDLEALRGCRQDPVWHAEGDVWTHAQMVLAELAALPAWRALPEADRVDVWAAAVFHDIAKPETTEEIDGRIRSPKHSLKGAMRTRLRLWEMGHPPDRRERVVALVRHHQVPFHLLAGDGRDGRDPHRLAARISQTLRCDHLCILAEADARGRIAPDREGTLLNIALAGEFFAEAGCRDRPMPFASDHTRFAYFRDESGTRRPDIEVYDDTTCEAVLMCGLPAAGKSAWVRTNAGDRPVISSDALRDELDVPPTGPQGAVFDRAREMAREHLRAGRDFVWDATNLSRQVRGPLIDLLAAYRARVRIVHVEADPDTLSARNRKRPSPVPSSVIADLARRRWEVPDLTEAHAVEHHRAG
jgi:predicted kinase